MACVSKKRSSSDSAISPLPVLHPGLNQFLSSHRCCFYLLKLQNSKIPLRTAQVIMQSLPPSHLLTSLPSTGSSGRYRIVSGFLFVRSSHLKPSRYLLGIDCSPCYGRGYRPHRGLAMSPGLVRLYRHQTATSVVIAS